MTLESIHDVAGRAVSDPANLTTADQVRLGSWILDHHDHVRAHHESVELQREMDQPGGGSPLVRRMMPPVPGDAPKLPLSPQAGDPEVQHPDVVEE